MRHILLVLLLVFTFTACQDKEQTHKEQAIRDAQIVKQVRLELKKEFARKEAKLQQTLAEKESQLLEQQTLNQATTQNIHQEPLASHADKLNNMGINVAEGFISIDTNKTRDFFKTLSNTMNAKIKEVNNDMEKGIIDIKNAGIEINNEHINIDLNKTKELLDTWSQKMQIFVQEFDSLSQNIDNNTTIKGN